MIIEKVISDPEGKIRRARFDSLFAAAAIDVHAKPVISLVGAGGKTSTIMTLSAELERAGIRHLVMTSTHMLPFEETVYRKSAGDVDEKGKLTMPEMSQWSAYVGEMPILIEADGSRRLPLKVPAAHEPVILEETTHVIGLIGASCFGRPVREVCQRYELLGDVDPDAVVTEAVLKRIICDPVGIRKMTGNRPFTLVINQADTEQIRTELMAMYPKIRDHVDQMIFTSRMETVL